MSRLASLLFAAVTGFLMLWAIGGPADPHAVDLSNRLAAPSTHHLIGTDHLGRDLATRVVRGALPSVSAVFIVVAGGIGVGVLAGGAIALGPPLLRNTVSWLAETALAIPTLVSALVLSAAFGAGPMTVAAALLITTWAPYALTIAALFGRIRGEAYWRASESLGAPTCAAVQRHMLPNAWPAIGALAGADAGTRRGDRRLARLPWPFGGHRPTRMGGDDP